MMDILKMLQDAGLPAKARPTYEESVRQYECARADRRAKVALDKSSHGIPCEETIFRFKEMCRKHDWYYGMSDDSRVYRIGKMQSDAIRAMMRKYPSLREIYREFSEGKML